MGPITKQSVWVSGLGDWNKTAVWILAINIVGFQSCVWTSVLKSWVWGFGASGCESEGHRGGPWPQRLTDVVEEPVALGGVIWEPIVVIFVFSKVGFRKLPHYLFIFIIFLRDVLRIRDSLSSRGSWVILEYLFR